MDVLPYLVAFAVATVLSVAVTWRAIRAQPRRGARWLAVTMAGVSWWSLMKLLEVLLVELERVQMLFNALHWIGVGIVSLGVLGFGLALTHRDGWLTRPRLAGLAVVPALSVLAWLGDPRVVDLLVHHDTVSPAIAVGLEAIEANWPWFRWVSLGYLWGVAALGGLFVLETALERPKLDPSRGLLLVMVGVPFAINVLYELGAVGSPEFDPTVLGFVVTGVAGIAAIGRYRLFDVPFARSRIVEQLSTPVLVFGSDDRLYDYNDRARSLLGIDVDDLDADIVTVLSRSPLPVSDGAAAAGETPPESLAGTRVALSDDDGNRRHFLVEYSPLNDGTPRNLGYTIQLMDITDKHRQDLATRRERNLKETIRSILVRLSSRDAIEQAFCDDLVADERYSQAWIGEDTRSGDVVPRTVANASSPDDADSQRTLPDAPAVATHALETGALTVERRRGGNEDAGREGPRAAHWVAAIPLRYERLTYGVLVVESSHIDGFDAEERQILEEIAESIGYAIHTAEQREALQAERVREVVFQIEATEHYLVSLSEQPAVADALTSAEIFEVVRDDAVGNGETASAPGEALHFLRVAVDDPATLVEAIADHPSVDSVSVLDDGDGVTSIRILARETPIGALVSTTGGVVSGISVVDAAIEVEAAFSTRIDMNQVVDQLREHYPEIQLKSIVTHDADQPRPPASPMAALTPKQRRALEAAYHSGFFARPQRQTADEIAATLDLSRTTFLSHLRAAEETLLGEVLTASADRATEILD